MEELKGKKVLFLAPKFFDYEIAIKKELENFGAKVFYFDERPKNDFLTKVLIRLNFRNLIQKQIDKYYKKIIEVTKDEKIDYLFLVSPETINIDKIKTLQNMHKNLKVYTYMWDSIKNKKNAFELIAISDKFFTFDPNDKKIDKKIEFLPLFYIDDYVKISDVIPEDLYDISFIGTVHSDRYRIVKNVESWAKNSGLKTYFYFYSPSRILFFFQKLLKKEFKNINNVDISFVPLRKNDVLDIIKKSKCIIDIQHPSQIGLTMRTIEMLGARRKLITTNQNIVEYDFYNSNNILIIQRDNVMFEKKFFDYSLQEIPKEIYQKYALSSWLEFFFKNLSHCPHTVS